MRSPVATLRCAVRLDRHRPKLRRRDRRCRFYMIGNGGHAGEALDDAGRVAQRNGALQLGFAFAQTNTGHDARKEPGATFVLSNPQKAIDYAYRAVHLTAATARDITKDYYEKPISYAYWNSCSNGGRQGLIEAQ